MSGSMVCPFSSTAFEKVIVARTLAIVIHTVASARYRPGHILYWGRRGRGDVHEEATRRRISIENAHLLPNPKASIGYALMPDSDSPKKRSGLKAMASG